MLRQLTSEDASVMAAIHAVSFNTGWPQSDMIRHIEKDMSLGWAEGGALAGFIIIQVAADQAEILTIAVDSGFRHMGIGLKLVEGGEISAREAGVDILFLEVAEDNPAAIALYRRAGYESFGRRPAYYKRPGGRVAAQLFRKNLRLAT